MRLFKYVMKESTVKEVDGEEWPGVDGDGEKCYKNTHFRTERKAWLALLSNAEAFVCNSGSEVHYAEKELAKAKDKAADAAKIYSLAKDNAHIYGDIK